MTITGRHGSPSDPTDDLPDLPLAGGRADAAGRDSPPRRRPGRWLWLWLVPVLVLPLGALSGYLTRPAPPQSVLSDDLLDFGEARLGAAGGELTIRITNRGEQALIMRRAVLEGEAAGEFAVASDGCTGTEVARRQACEIRLAFMPDLPGSRRARLRLAGNGQNSPQTVDLLGVGVAPNLSVEPLELDFGLQRLDGSGATAKLWLGNRGTAPLRLSTVVLEGPHAGDFSEADGCEGRTLAPGRRCSVRLRFIPRQAGERRASVRVVSDAAQAAAAVPLVGFGVLLAPRLRVTHEPLEFGSLAVGEASPPRRVSLSNDGAGPLRIRGVRVTAQPVAARGIASSAAAADAGASGGGRVRHFELVVDDCSGEGIAPGDSCAFEVVFRPLAEGEVRAVVEIEHDAGAAPHRMALEGSGRVTRISVEPSRLTFGSVGVEETSPVLRVRVAASGSGELALGRIGVIGGDARSFAAEGCSGAVLAPGAVCTVEIRFRPRRPGPHRTELEIPHNAAGDRRRLPVNGLGRVARLSVEPGRLDLGDVAVGGESQRRLTLRNSGRAELVIRRLRLTGGSASGFELRDDGCSGTVLGVGQTCSVAVRFAPRAGGAGSIRLTIEHSGSGSPQEVPVTARAGQ